MKHLPCLIAFLLCASNSANAEGVPVFPTMSQVVGGIKLPQADGSQLNPKFEKDVLRKYNFESTWQSMVLGAIKVELIKARSKICGDKVGNDIEFVVTVFSQTKYDAELTALVNRTDATKKVREYFAYQTLPTPTQYQQLAAIPSNDLSRKFVADWIASGYLESSHSTIVELAESFLHAKCDS